MKSAAQLPLLLGLAVVDRACRRERLCAEREMAN